MLGQSTDEGTGELQSVDGYMNIGLEKCEEHVNGVKKRSYGDAFIRGNNGTTTLHELHTIPLRDVVRKKKCGGS